MTGSVVEAIERTRKFFLESGLAADEIDFSYITERLLSEYASAASKKIEASPGVFLYGNHLVVNSDGTSSFKNGNPDDGADAPEHMCIYSHSWTAKMRKIYDGYCPNQAPTPFKGETI